MKNYIKKTISVLLVFLIPVIALAQEMNHPETVVCPTDGYVNKWASNFCVKDGTSLVATKNSILENLRREKSVEQLQSKPAMLEVGMSKLFHLRDGNIIKGLIIEIEGDTIAVIETTEGVLRIPSVEILEEMADLVKLDGSHFVGPVLSEDEFSISIKTPYGMASILKKDIRTMDRYYGDKKVSWTEEKRRFLSGDDIIDLFLDPTAFPLQQNVVYISGLSVGYGFTESFMLRTEFGKNLAGDLNLHPLVRLYHSSTGKSETAFSLGFTMYNRHSAKGEASKYSHWILDSAGVRLNESGVGSIESALKKPEEKMFFTSVYMVLSKKQSLKSGRGKWGWHLGMKTNSLSLGGPPELNAGFKWDEKFNIPYRIWGGMDYDLTKKLKFLIEVYADNGHKYTTFSETIDSYFDFEGTPFTFDTQEGEYRPVDLDFGFLYAINEQLRLGAHFQAPYLILYWKFYEF